MEVIKNVNIFKKRKGNGYIIIRVIFMCGNIKILLSWLFCSGNCECIV